MPVTSNSVTSAPSRAAWCAAVSPARPPPITATSQRFFSGLIGRQSPGSCAGAATHAPFVDALREMDRIEMVEQRHRIFARDVERGGDFGDEPSARMQQRFESASRALDRIAMKNHSLSLGAIARPNHHALPKPIYDPDTH